MDLNHLRYFVRAAELLHFTKAAESLYIPQPTLSVHIQQLEEEFGAPLFSRIGRNVRLTQAGELLLERSKNVIRELELAQQEITSLRGLLSGTFKIGSLLAFSIEMVPLWLGAFTRIYPEVHLVATSGTHQLMEQSVLNGTVELALSFLPTESDDIDYQELFTEDVVLVVANDHPLANRGKVGLKDLAKIPLALPSRQQNTRKLLDSLFVKYKVEPNVVAEIDDLHALLTMVKLGNGVTVMTRMAVGDYQGLTVVDFIEHDHHLRAIAMWDRRIGLTPAGKAFLEVINTHCSRDE